MPHGHQHRLGYRDESQIGKARRQVKSDSNGFMARLKRGKDEEYEEYRFLNA